MNHRSSIPLVLLAAAAGAAMPLALLPGCAPPKAEKTAFTEPPAAGLRPARPYVNRTRPVAEPLGMGAGRLASRTELLSQNRVTGVGAPAEGVAPTMVAGAPGELVRVRIAANNQNSSEVFRIIFAEYLKMGYILDGKATGAVTLDVDEEMTKADLIDLAGAICTIYGWTLELRDGTALIRGGDALPRAEAPVLQARAGLPSDLPVIRVKRMRYVAADQALNVLKELMSATGKSIAQGRTIVLADTARQVNKAAAVLAALDAPAFEGSEIWTYRLGSRRPEEAKKILGEIASGAGINAQNDATVAFVDITGTDRLMVISKDPTLQPVLRGFVEMVDQPPGQATRQRYLYRVQHFEPQALQTFLKAAFAERIESENAQSRSAGDTNIRLVLDPQEALLMIYATPEDYAEVLGTLRAVDRPRQQVAISSIIAEVGLTGRLEYGVEYFLRALDVDGIGIAELTGTPGLIAGATGGAFFAAGDGFAVVRALQNEADVNLMSLPQLSIRDGDKGSIQVGGEVPVVKADIDSSTQNQGTTGIRRSIEYRKTGVILDIEPNVNESGEVTLKITQEVTAVGQQTDLGPEFTTRKIETKVTVPAGQTVLLGGIIDSARRDSVNKIPILGDIPLVGLAFQTQRLQNVRTELLLAITPTILPEPSDGAAAYSDFLERAGAVREALYDLAQSLPRGSMRFDGPEGPGGPALPSAPPAERPDTAPEEAPPAEPPAPAQGAGGGAVSPGVVHG